MILTHASFTAQIATHLNITASAILEIQEWAKVLWMRFKGGCRFVSKKITEVKMTSQQLAEQALKKLSCPLFGKLSLWSKVAGETRIYLKKFGYVSITNKIDLSKVTYYNSTVIELLGDLIDVIAEVAAPVQADQEDAMIKKYGIIEVLDAQADVAREDWDI